jgi:hypothetical protein
MWQLPEPTWASAVQELEDSHTSDASGLYVGHICFGTDWARPATCHICPSTGLTLPTSAPGLGSPRPNLHRDSHASGLRANKLQHGATVPMRQPCAVSYVAALLRARRVHAAVPAACGCVTRIGAWLDRPAAAPTLDRPAHAQQSRPDSCAALPSGLTRPRPSQDCPAVARQALGHLSNKQTNKQTNRSESGRARPQRSVADWSAPRAHAMRWSALGVP